MQTVAYLHTYEGNSLHHYSSTDAAGWLHQVIMLFNCRKWGDWKPQRQTIASSISATNHIGCEFKHAQQLRKGNTMGLLLTVSDT
jgi:hypothetical protein